MPGSRLWWFPLMVTLFLGAAHNAFCQVHHDLQVQLSPDRNLLSVVDHITLPEKWNGPVRFQLHQGLNPQILGDADGISLVMEASNKRSPGVDPALHKAGVQLEGFKVQLPVDTREFTIRYSGPVFHPIEELGEQYARSFSVTPGIVATEGVFLGGSSYWYPVFNDGLITFSMEVDLPGDWRAVTQGRRSQRQQREENIRETWISDQPQEEIYLIAGDFTEYLETSDEIDAMVMLRQPDPGLARKYLDTTFQYLQMYQQLLGPYPYSKFALVENFWETGYGMPSFTLLGPRVIRLPFILHSSYPHEILHNWWGNSVYVDYDTGNWSEGLTTYLADHLIKEQQGQGGEYRRSTLQKYTDYVREHRDFRLTDFRGRHDAVTEAVGYGKTMMLFHMLRQELGDDVFVDALRQFYLHNRFMVADFAALARVFLGTGGKVSEAFFEQWVRRSGAPILRVSGARTVPVEDGFLLSALIEQIQPGPAYRLRLPLAVYLRDHDKAFQSEVIVESKRHALELLLPAKPLRLDIDPEFDVFRRLDRNEIPPAISQVFGAEQALIVLPADAPGTILRVYQDLALSWQSGRPEQIEIKHDRELERLPDDRAVWLFGWENRFRPVVSAALADAQYDDMGDGLLLGGTRLDRVRHNAVVVSRLPANPEYALGWIAADNVAAIPGLGRKLPHYGKYSYLGFSGDESENVLKGQWPVIHSPMSVAFEQGDSAESTFTASKVKLKARNALAQPPPVFSPERMLDDIAWLAAAEREGREAGSVQLDRAADYIAGVFQTAGLQPGGDEADSYFQHLPARIGEPPREVTLRNVIAVLPGSNAEWSKQGIVIGAHYDHLGRGWPDVHAGDEGRIHPGADDNASGVALLLELARTLGKGWVPPRTIRFVAFTGEEAGRLGSTHYLQAAEAGPERPIAMLNLDTVGRLGNKDLLVLGAGSARQWEHIFRGAGYVTGVPVKTVMDDIGSSDQKSFLDAGIPAVQLFSGTHPDYHRPTDSVDKIDPAGLVKTAAVVKEALEYLATNPEPVTSSQTIRDDRERNQTAQVSPGSRRVTLGTVPDYAYSGPGIRISGTSPGTPAEQAGLREGDIIVGMNDTDLANLRDLSNMLQALHPGDVVALRIVRDGLQLTVSTKLTSR